MPIIPIIPSINTCMSLTTTTTTSTNSKAVTVPEVNTTQLQALADVCSTVNTSVVTPIANPVMNSLVSPTKVVTNDDIVNPIPTCVASNIELPKKIPISIVAMPIMDTKAVSHVSDTDTAIMRDLETETEPIDATDTIDATSNINVNPEIENCDKEILPDVSTSSSFEKSVDKLDEDINIDEKPADISEMVTTNDAVLDDDNNCSPLSTTNEPMECSSSITSQTSPKDDLGKQIIGTNEDVIMADSVSISDTNVN